ncbi:MAG: helix-turn-helix domain-containing protein [Armatimonadetes bacterium]|nr:helix-turn-helix domain-containing protein [Armatimonadota bacterium]
MNELKNKSFDPIAYIENAFADSSATIGTSEHIPSSKIVAGETQEGKVKFRKRKLSAPRPRKVKTAKAETPVVDSQIEEIWASLPRNIQFLSSFFDDSVTANYYRGEFKETRQELIRRLLDPELTLEEVSRLLGVCPATVRRYTNRGWLTHHRTRGGQRRFRLTGVVKFVEEHGRHPEE